jgi:hypothetical protein
LPGSQDSAAAQLMIMLTSIFPYATSVRSMAVALGVAHQDTMAARLSLTRNRNASGRRKRAALCDAGQGSGVSRNGASRS